MCISVAPVSPTYCTSWGSNVLLSTVLDTVSANVLKVIITIYYYYYYQLIGVLSNQH